MSKKLILCDVDGVLLDWTSRLPHYMQELGQAVEPAIRLHATGEFTPLTEVFDMDREQELEFIRSYNRTGHLSQLTAYRDALLYVKSLSEDYDFVAITAIGTDESIIQARTENLEFWYPGIFKDVVCVGVQESKFDALSKYSRSIFIDDQPRYVDEAIRAGHIGVRLKRRVNDAPHQGFNPRNWAEVNDLIKNNCS